MTKQICQLHSTIEIQLDDLEELIEEIELPQDIRELTTEERENIYVIKSETDSNDIGQYTPTANLKASLEDKKPHDEKPESNGLWSPQYDPDEDVEEVDDVTYAGFKGYGESVLFNKALQYPMFEILCEIALNADTGKLSAIIFDDGELTPVRIVDGEKREAEVKVIDTLDSEKKAEWTAN